MTTSLYRLRNSDGDLLYVGIADDVMRRLSEHAKDKDWYGEVCDVDVEHFGTREEALTAETNAIETEGPKYNKAGVRAWYDEMKAQRREERERLRANESKAQPVSEESQGPTSGRTRYQEEAEERDKYRGQPRFNVAKHVVTNEWLVTEARYDVVHVLGIVRDEDTAWRLRDALWEADHWNDEGEDVVDSSPLTMNAGSPSVSWRLPSWSIARGIDCTELAFQSHLEGNVIRLDSETDDDTLATPVYITCEDDPTIAWVVPAGADEEETIKTLILARKDARDRMKQSSNPLIRGGKSTKRDSDAG